MAQFNCEICGAGFEQKSRYERHLMTSHPKQAISAEDIEKSLKGVAFPKTRDELVDSVKHYDQADIMDVLRELPNQEYRDAAEVARAFGEIRSHEEKPDGQPSKKGGKQAMKAPSAAKMTSLFSNMEFPASGRELKEFARNKASDEEMKIIEKFGDHTYNSMRDVAKELGKVS